MTTEEPFAADKAIKQINDNYVKPFDVDYILYVMFKRGKLCINRRLIHEQQTQSVHK